VAGERAKNRAVSEKAGDSKEQPCVVVVVVVVACFTISSGSRMRVCIFFRCGEVCTNCERRKMENSLIQEERQKIRELHQRQQDSLKSLQALENRFCRIGLDDEETRQGSSASSRVPTLDLMLGPQSTTRPPLEKNQRHVNKAILTEEDFSDTSQSDATATDDEGEHLSLEELAKCAKHVQRLLKHITQLQQSFQGSQQTHPHRKRRVNKMYQRFRYKFESDLQVIPPPPPPPPPPVAGSSGFELLGSPGEFENIDFDSFLKDTNVDRSPGDASSRRVPVKPWVDAPSQSSTLFTHCQTLTLDAAMTCLRVRAMKASPAANIALFPGLNPAPGPPQYLGGCQPSPSVNVTNVRLYRIELIS
jgi:hypothetical protein